MDQIAARRRDFLKVGFGVAVGVGLLGTGRSLYAQSQPARLLKACQFRMLPKDLADGEKFALARQCGFDGIEHSPMGDPVAANELGALSRQAGVPTVEGLGPCR
jgi:hypothetical protein